MAVAQRYIAQQSSGRGGPSGLADVLEVLLDKGLVIDAFVRVSLVGIELLTVDARVVVASVDTYLRFAEAVNRLDLLQSNNSQTLGDMIGRPSRQSAENNGTRRREGGSEEQRNSSRPAEIGARASSSDDQQESGDSEDRGGDEQGSSPEGGLLSRIKQRGQAF